MAKPHHPLLEGAVLLLKCEADSCEEAVDVTMTLKLNLIGQCEKLTAAFLGQQIRDQLQTIQSVLRLQYTI